MGKKAAERQSLRVLGRLRLSRISEESTSISRQREVVQQWADVNGHTVIGWAVDENVSGSVDPFDTPSFGGWLNEKHEQFDVVCAWRLDRLGRDSIRLNKLFGWCQEFGKTLVSCSEGIDLSTPVGRLIGNVVAFLAEGELEAIRERQSASREKLRREARWPGGRPPYGYKQARNETGDGWVLEVDPKAASVVRRITGAVLAGTALNAVAAELNREGVLAPTEHYRQQTGKPVGDSKWRQAPMKLMLQSKALLGVVHFKGEAVRDDQGAPVRMAPELITADEFNRVQSVLAGVESRYVNRVRDASPLSGLVSCFFCGKGLTFTQNVKGGKRYAYYRHPVNSGCEGAGLVPLERLQTDFEAAFMGVLGGEAIRERVWLPGDDRESELREAVQAFDELTAAAGRMSSQTARTRLQSQLAALDTRIGELESAPRREGGWEWVEVGGTYGDAWAAADVDGRRELLGRSGITVAAGVRRDGRGSNDGGWFVNVLIPVGLLAAESRLARRLQELLGEQSEAGIAGVVVDGDRVTFHSVDGRSVELSDIE